MQKVNECRYLLAVSHIMFFSFRAAGRSAETPTLHAEITCMLLINCVHIIQEL